jgi:sarcosine oxidase subunit beta
LPLVSKNEGDVLEHFDVVVIGAGVAGTSCLYHLSEKGLTRALLIEQTAVAAGSSGRSAAFIETQYVDVDRIRLGVYAEDILERFRAEHDLPFVQNGKILLALNQSELAQLELSAAAQRELGASGTALLTRDEVSNQAPQLETDDVVGALFGPRDGYTDPPRLCQLFIDLASTRGAEMRRCRVIDIVQHNGRVSGVLTTDGRIACDAVVNAAGAWAGDIAALAGLHVPVRGYRREVVVLEDGRGMGGDLPIVVEPLGSLERNLYLRGDGGNLIIAGIHFEGEDEEEPSNPTHFETNLSWQAQETIGDLVRRRLRDGDDLGLRVGWAGLYPVSDDRRPIIGEARAMPGFWNLAGLGGNGIQLSPGFGAVVADELVDGRTSLLPDMERYRLERFAAASPRR